MDILKDPNRSFFIKMQLVKRQVCYLKKLGVLDNKTRIQDSNDIEEYLKLLEKEDLKKYLPNELLLDTITALRQRAEEKMEKEYFETRSDFQQGLKKIKPNSLTSEAFYDAFKNSRIAVPTFQVLNENNKPVCLIFYTIKQDRMDSILCDYIHETGHVIEFKNEEFFGLEKRSDPIDETTSKRRYEPFIETINQMFANNVFKYIQSLDIEWPFALEDQKEDLSHSPSMELLNPLFVKYKEYIVKAKMKADREILINYIGRDNFEELIDIINRIDILINQGLVKMIKDYPTDPMVKEYSELLKKSKNIYEKIDAYYNQNFGDKKEELEEVKAEKKQV